MDSEELLNELIEAFIPVINKNIPKWIEDAGLDPWKEVVDGKETLGKINLGVCTAKVKASYDIKNMEGLSSLIIDNATLSNVDFSDLSKVTGDIKLNAELTSKLKADVSGKLKAECGVISESVKISGNVKATDVTGTGKGSFSADLSGGACLTTVKLSSLSLDYKDIDVNIDGLGIFNDFLDPLVDLIDDIFGSAIKGEIANAVKPVLNSLLEDELPYCL